MCSLKQNQRMTPNEFLELIAPFKDRVYRLAKRLLRSTEEAEDATQEVLLKLWTHKRKIKDYKNVAAFSMTMTKNFCYDKLKSKQAQHLKIADTDYEEKNMPLQRQIELNDSINWVERIIAELPEQQRIIIQLRDVEGYDFEAIAQLLELNPTAVRVALSRARKKIRIRLTEIHNYGIT